MWPSNFQISAEKNTQTVHELQKSIPSWPLQSKTDFSRAHLNFFSFVDEKDGRLGADDFGCIIWSRIEQMQREQLAATNDRLEKDRWFHI